MISDVVFVLGAGASVPYGFPSGRDLIEKILAIRKDDVHSSLGKSCDEINQKMGFDPNLVLGFQLALARSQLNSLDAFLAHRGNRCFHDVGRFLIAAELIPCEQKVPLLTVAGKGPNQRWYQLLWNNIAEIEQPESLEDVGITFVTFNYDRSLEQYLATVFEYHLHATKEQIAGFLRKNVHHVHGSLGNHRALGTEDYLPYSPHLNLDAIRSAMVEIKITHEAASFPGKAIVQQRIKSAKRLVFLGFGYHRDNIQKLLGGVRTDAVVFGSAFGLTELEAKSAGRRVAGALGLDEAKVRVMDPSFGCHDFLRHHFEFD